MDFGKATWPHGSGIIELLIDGSCISVVDVQDALISRYNHNRETKLKNRNRLSPRSFPGSMSRGHTRTCLWRLLFPAHRTAVHCSITSGGTGAWFVHGAVLLIVRRGAGGDHKPNYSRASALQYSVTNPHYMETLLFSTTTRALTYTTNGVPLIIIAFINLSCQLSQILC